MGIKDFELNFEMIQGSKKISCERKRELFQNFLNEIEMIFFHSSEYNNSPEKESAENLYSQIKNYLNEA